MSASKKQNNKPKVVKKAKKPSVSPPSVDEISKAEQNNINQLIAQSLLRHKEEVAVDQKSKFKELTHLALMCEEYLSSFALIGYSLQDEKVVMFNMPSPKDEAALVDLLRATFVELVSNRP